MRCVINRQSLGFSDINGKIPVDSIDHIRIYHHWYYDELHVTLTNGSERVVKAENAKIQVNDGGFVRSYSLCKMDCIFLGK